MLTQEEINALQEKAKSLETTLELAKAGLQRIGIADLDLTKLGNEVKLEDFTNAIETTVQNKILASDKLEEYEPIKKISEEKTKVGINKARLELLKAVNGDDLIDANTTKLYWDEALEQNPKNPDAWFYKKISTELKKKASLTDSEIKQKMGLYEKEVAENKNKLSEYEKAIREKELEIKKINEEIIPEIKNQTKAFLEQKTLDYQAFKQFLTVPIVPITKAQSEEQRDASIEAFFDTLLGAINKKYKTEKTASGEVVFYTKSDNKLLYRDGVAKPKTYKDLFEEEAKLLGLYDYQSNGQQNNNGKSADSPSQKNLDKMEKVNRFSKVD